MNSRNRNRKAFLITIALFVLPVIFAFVLHKTGWYKSAGTSNKGSLIDPPLTAESLALESLIPEDFSERKWWIIYIMPNECSKACENSLYQMRQIHKALGPDQARVSRLLITTENPSESYQSLIDQEFPNLETAQLTDTQLETAFAKVPSTTIERPQDHIYLMDTMGAIFMVYPTYEDEQTSILKGRDLLKDLRKVLKLSKIG